MSGAEEFSGFSKLVCTRTLFYLHEGTHISFAFFLVGFWFLSLGSGCRVPKRIREITQLLSFQLSPKPYFGPLALKPQSIAEPMAVSICLSLHLHIALA